MNRRHFLNWAALNASQLALAASWGSFFNVSKVLANSSLNSYFVLFYVDGGWDVTSAMDAWKTTNRPNETDLHLDYSESELLVSGQHIWGPAMQPLLPFAHDIAVINGILLSLNDNGHEAGTTLMTTGQGSGISGSMALEHEMAFEQSTFGLVQNSSVLSGQHALYSTWLTNLETVNFQLAGLTTDILFSRPSPIEQSFQKLKQTQSDILRLKNDLDKLNLKDNIRNAAALGLSFKYGLARSAHLNLRPNNANLDTHSQHVDNHKNSLKSYFQEIANVLSAFQMIETSPGTSLYSQTTFLVVSEFSRTAALNAAKGKDHNPRTNSALLIGPKIRGNQTIGASRLVTQTESLTQTSYSIAQAIDFKNGAVILDASQAWDKGQFIQADNIAATVAEALNIPRKLFGQHDWKAPIVPNLLK